MHLIATSTGTQEKRNRPFSNKDWTYLVICAANQVDPVTSREVYNKLVSQGTPAKDISYTSIGRTLRRLGYNVILEKRGKKSKPVTPSLGTAEAQSRAKSPLETLCNFQAEFNSIVSEAQSKLDMLFRTYQEQFNGMNIQANKN